MAHKGVIWARGGGSCSSGAVEIPLSAPLFHKSFNTKCLPRTHDGTKTCWVGPEQPGLGEVSLPMAGVGLDDF